MGIVCVDVCLRARARVCAVGLTLCPIRRHIVRENLASLSHLTNVLEAHFETKKQEKAAEEAERRARLSKASAGAARAGHRSVKHGAAADEDGEEDEQELTLPFD